MFKNRVDAGQKLAKHLSTNGLYDYSVVLALPRGGVPVGIEIANKLALPIDILLVRKLAVPPNMEFAVGAIASGGCMVLNDDIISVYGISTNAIEKQRQIESAEISRRETLYRNKRPEIPIKGKNVIIVDDGLATGATMSVAIKVARSQQAKTVTAAIPVAAKESLTRIKQAADQVVCLVQPSPFIAVGNWYHDFTQLSDKEIQNFLTNAWR